MPTCSTSPAATPTRRGSIRAVQQLSELQKDVKVEAYEDYRRILDRTDIDAVLIATPDHWHSQMLIDAMAAGKDVYVEKPLSNTVERAVEALRAYKASKRVVQLGTQQRSGQHFQEAAKIVQDGQLGKITHAVIQFGGSGYGTPPEPEAPVPDGLNWDLFQGPAPRRPFKQGRLRWRGWWDYGGGLITDWGVHLTDVALWYLNAQHVGPSLTSGTAQYVNFVNPERDQSPDAFSVSWQYPELRHDLHECGRTGLGVRTPGKLLLWPGWQSADPPRRLRGEARWRAGWSGARRSGPGERPARHGEGRHRMPRRRPRRTRSQARRVPWRESDGSDSSSATIAHARNFLDSLKSRSKPLSELEVGFYASLPCLLAVKAVREGRSFRWDDAAKKAVPV